MIPDTPLLDFALALGLGLIVGLQRQHVASPLAGLRTFPLITLLGFASALLGATPLSAAFVALAVVIAIGVYSSSPPAESGITSEVAMLLLFAVGALLGSQQRLLALAIGATTAVLLEFKGELHGLAAKLSHDDVRAIMRFVLLSLVILPALPDRAFGPYAVLNPRQIWWMVVLVVGIDLAGYLLGKLRPRTSPWWQGLLGGLVSSTATTAAYAKRVGAGEAGRVFSALIIAIASSVVFLRVNAEIAAVSWTLWREAWLPLAIATVTLGGSSWLAWRRVTREAGPESAPENPTQLGGAFWFAALYSGVLFVSAAAHANAGDRWMVLVSLIGGLTDVDAITLSTARLVETGRVPATEGARMIFTGVLSNTLFKLLLAGWLGGWALAKSLGQILLPVFGLLLLWLLSR